MKSYDGSEKQCLQNVYQHETWILCSRSKEFSLEYAQWLFEDAIINLAKKNVCMP